jgi:dynein heavy chain
MRRVVASSASTSPLLDVMNTVNKKNQQRLNDLIGINLQTDQQLAVHGRWTRCKVETMILVDVHARDVFDVMVKKKVKDVEDFEWSKQARFYQSARGQF